MKAIVRVFTYEFRRQSRRRAYLFVTIGLPLLAILIFYGFRYFQRSTSSNQKPQTPEIDSSFTRPIGLVDEAGLTPAGARTVSGFPVFDSEEAAQSAMEKGRISAYYVVPKDYRDTGALQMYFQRFSFSSLTSDSLNAVLVEGLLKGQNVNRDMVAQLQAQPTFQTHTISEAGGENKTTSGDTSFGLAYVFDIVLLVSAFMTSGYLMQSIVEEKESKMIEVLLSSIRPTELLAGKILALGALGLIQVTVWAGTLIFLVRQLADTIPELSGITPPGGAQAAVVILYFILGYLLLATLYAAIGALATNMREGPQLAAFVAIPVALPTYFLSIIAGSPGGTLAVAFSLFPFTAPITMVSRASISEVPLPEILLSVTLLVLTIMLTMWLAGRLFRVNTLLAGQMPRLRDLPRLIRETI